ncbi:DUF3618 domain-containing protein [Glaciihabitans arcticus]|uniref:DUF3618 domain-containing protein n=1 Tax=Glaciihabitans arcticus TaxID=2668039 RepID=A0A4V2JF51_9MICO|nr:DUF3618 domain-containing protein [Glaciihabitans arcticus]TBN58189.1 DUF3618 domain-containing protein [Glaciihabitans arcticus]
MTDAIQTRIATQRAALEDTLDQIEERINVPRQVGRLTDKAKASYDENPVPWIIGATAVAISVVGIVAWALLSDD